MIPGKIFFESIDISEHFTKKYEIYLLMNGIFYDKIKPFQSKYLCLTANDALEVELGLKTSQSDKENDRTFAEIKPIKTEAKKLPSQYLKVLIPQAFKLVIQSKTIDIKFELNSKNGNEQIKINFSFEPVSSFNRKKLGATITSNRNAKNPSNFNVSQQRLNGLQKREKNQQSFGQSSGMSSPNSKFGQKIDFSRGKNSYSRSPGSSQERGSMQREFEVRTALSKTMQSRSRGYFRQKINSQSLTAEQTKHPQRKFNYIPHDVIIQDDSSSYTSNKFFSSTTKKQTLTQQPPQGKYKVDTMKRVINLVPHSNHATNIQMLSDIMDNQTYTTRGGMMFEGSEHKGAGEKSGEQQVQSRNIQNSFNYQTEGNQQPLFDSVSQQDTLQSLAYQRQKILGELFGKLGAKGRTAN